MNRVVLFGIPEEGRRAGEQGMVFICGERSFCLCWGIQKMRRRDRAVKKGVMEHHCGP